MKLLKLLKDSEEEEKHSEYNFCRMLRRMKFKYKGMLGKSGQTH